MSATPYTIKKRKGGALSLLKNEVGKGDLHEKASQRFLLLKKRPDGANS